jgi:hypothetical protein
VNWGLKFFPDNGNMTTACNVSTVPEVAIGPKNASAVTVAINGATATNGGVVGYSGTPTRAAITGAQSYLQSLTDMNPKFILLATDGVPTCGTTAGMMGAQTNDPTAPTALSTARDAGFKTFVVGIGTASAEATLSEMATAGGLPRSGTPAYYPVSSSDDLAAAIRTLIGVAATCTFKVGPAPDDVSTDLSKINVFGDGMEIPRDPNHKDGYDYTDASMQSIEVFGPRCQKIMSAEIKDVTVTFRCIIN